MKAKETGVYKYVIEHDNSSYSGFFDTEVEAKLWYKTHGKQLELMFGRKLVLKNQEEENKIAKDMIQRELLKANKKRKTQLLKIKHEKNGSCKTKKDL